MQELLLALAVWRVTSLIVNEDGPFDIFVRFRQWVGVYYDEYSEPQGKNVIAKAMTCTWCFSVWVAFPFTFLGDKATNIFSFIVVWLALSAGAIIIERVVDVKS